MVLKVQVRVVPVVVQIGSALATEGAIAAGARARARAATGPTASGLLRPRTPCGHHGMLNLLSLLG
jgi:hypothetical protein